MVGSLATISQPGLRHVIGVAVPSATGIGTAAGATAAGSRTLKKMAYITGVTSKHRTAANDSPNMMHTAIAPKNGSVSSGIIPRTVVKTTMHTGRDLVIPPTRIA